MANNLTISFAIPTLNPGAWGRLSVTAEKFLPACYSEVFTSSHSVKWIEITFLNKHAKVLKPIR